MAEAAVGTLVQVLVTNLISMLSGEIKLVRDFKDGLTKLQDSLSMTQEFLSDAEEKEIKDKAAKKWLKELEDVAFEADNVLDEINYHILRKKVRNQKRKTDKVSSSSSSDSINLFFRTKMARKINDLNKKFETINKNAESNGLKQKVVSAPSASSIGIVETDSFSVEPNVVGRETEVAKIVEMAVNTPLDEKISVIPIVGMGGLGKTTVAQQVFHDNLIANHFQKRLWICASVFDEITLFQKILETLTGENVQGIVTKQVMLEKIHKNLESKRYLIILDDLWNEDSKKWEDFMKSILGISNITQNVIVITTRKETIASLTKTLSFHKLISLTTDDCWSIIKVKALSSVDDPLEYEEIGKCIAEKCGGLPLAANVTGGMLRGKPKEEWSFILKNQLSNLGRDDGDNHVMKILKLSYDRLPSSSLKRCFAYCSIFPQDFQIEKETLIKQWLAEGFLQTNQENDHLENIGSHFFSQLLHASLIQESERDYLGNITHCTMHDLVHDVACSVSGYRSTTVVKDSGNDSNKDRYLYLNSHDPYHISKEHAKVLRTLVLNRKVVDTIFSSFSSLHVLNLDSSIEKFPVEIVKQIHMRFLDISTTKITNLPDSINKLSSLQTLRAKNLHSLPNSIIDLINLRHLQISPIELPPFIGNLTSLRTLPYYIVGHDSGCKIGELGKLKNLTGRLEIKNLERVKDKEEAEHADLFGKPNISELFLVWTRLGEGEKNDENVLDGLRPHPNLKVLKIYGYGNVNFPSWTLKMTVYNAIESRWTPLVNLISIGFEDCQCEKLPNLGHLPRLKFLSLTNLHRVQSIDRSLYGMEYCSTSNAIDRVNIPKTTVVFPALEKLRLQNMLNLKEWEDVESGVATFPCLEYLEIKTCPNLEKFPSRFPCLKTLIVEEIGSNVSLTNICTNTSSLQQLQINKYSGIIQLSEIQQVSLSSPLPSLQSLLLEDCCEMKSIPNFGLRSLQKLVINNCRALTCLPLELIESCTSSLQALHLMNLPNVENMNGVMSCISRMSSLERLSLYYLPKLTNLPNLEIGCLKGLWFLQIGGFSKSMDQVSFNDFLKRVFNESPRLQILSIFGNEDWVSLPDHIQHLSLYELRIFDYGIEALTEWIGNFSSLQRLCIWGCKRLRHLSSKETMQRLTKLSHLSIDDCPLLKTQQERTPGVVDGDSEWSKISHIEYVRVDGELLPTRNTPAAEKKSPDFNLVRRRYIE